MNALDSSTDVTTLAGMDLWRVQLASGEVRAMTIDALDDAFQAGTIDEATPVLPPGAVAWTRLADAAGLDAPAAAAATPPSPESAVPSVAPMAVSVATPSTPLHLGRDPLAFAEVPDLPEYEPADFKTSKSKIFVGIGLAVMLVGGLGFAASRVASSASASASNAITATAPETKAAAAQPPPAAVDPNVEGAKGRVLTEEQKAKLAEADKARAAADAQKKKDRPAPPAHRAPRDKSAPFTNGGSKYDPLNGAL